MYDQFKTAWGAEFTTLGPVASIRLRGSIRRGARAVHARCGYWGCSVDPFIQSQSGGMVTPQSPADTIYNSSPRRPSPGEVVQIPDAVRARCMRGARAVRIPWCTSRGVVGCRIQDLGIRGYRWWKTADFSHSARCAPNIRPVPPMRGGEGHQVTVPPTPVPVLPEENFSLAPSVSYAFWAK